MSEVAVTESKAATADVQEAGAMDLRNKNNKKRVPSSSPSKSLSKKSKKKQNRQRAAIEEERTLMASLFGESGIDDDAGFVRHQHPAANQSKQTATKNKTSNAAAAARAEEFTFEIDRMGDPSLTAPSEPLNNDDEASSRSSSDDDDVDQYDPSSGPAWVDEDDDKNDNTVNLMNGSNRLRKLRHSKAEKDVSGAQLQQRLRERFQVTTQTTARTDWAQLKHPTNNNNNSDDDDEDDDDQQDGTVSASTRLLVAQHRGRKLVPHSLATKRCPDANQSDPNHAVVQAIDFHPSSDPDRPLLLTAGLDKSLRFFQVTEERSDKIHGIHCEYMLFSLLVVVDTRHVSNSKIDSPETPHLQCRISRFDWQRAGNWTAALFLPVRFGRGQSRSDPARAGSSGKELGKLVRGPRRTHRGVHGP